jgi:hypothetical protein
MAQRLSGLRVIEVNTKRRLHGLVTHLLGERNQPVIVLALMDEQNIAVLPPRGVRSVAGPEPRIYIVRHDPLLDQLTDILGPGLALTRGALRVYWPGLSTESDPRDHPLVEQVESEYASSLMDEFALRFDLSRPRVRGEIKTLEDMRGLTERELERSKDQLTRAEQRVRDLHVSCHNERMRADAAEAELDRQRHSHAASDGAREQTGR